MASFGTLPGFSYVPPVTPPKFEDYKSPYYADLEKSVYEKAQQNLGMSYEDWKSRFTPETSEFYTAGQDKLRDILNTDYSTPDYLESVEKPYLDTLLKEYKTSRGEGFKPVQESLIAENLYGSGPGLQRMQEYGKGTAEGVGDISKQWAYEGIERRMNQDRYYDALKRGDMQTAYEIALMEEERSLQPAREATEAERGSIETGRGVMGDIGRREQQEYGNAQIPYQAEMDEYLRQREDLIREEQWDREDAQSEQYRESQKKAQESQEKQSLIGTGAGIVGEIGSNWMMNKLFPAAAPAAAAAIPAAATPAATAAIPAAAAAAAAAPAAAQTAAAAAPAAAAASNIMTWGAGSGAIGIIPVAAAFAAIYAGANELIKHSKTPEDPNIIENDLSRWTGMITTTRGEGRRAAGREDSPEYQVEQDVTIPSPVLDKMTTDLYGVSISDNWTGYGYNQTMTDEAKQSGNLLGLFAEHLKKLAIKAAAPGKRDTKEPVEYWSAFDPEDIEAEIDRNPKTAEKTYNWIAENLPMIEQQLMTSVQGGNTDKWGAPLTEEQVVALRTQYPEIKKRFEEAGYMDIFNISNT